jgi:hypothetical protein
MARAPDEDPFEDLAQAIGMLVISFNELEVALGGALMHVLGRTSRRAPSLHLIYPLQ